MFDTLKTSEYAFAMYRACGDKAEAIAAQRERHSADNGDRDGAETWRAIRRIIRQKRGANQS